MDKTIQTLIESRVSTNYYDTDKDVSEDKIRSLVRLASLAPSAYNFQNWKFIAVRTRDAKQRLAALSYGQQKVLDAPLTFIICGTLKAHEALPRILQPSVEHGVIDTTVFDSWVRKAKRTHTDDPQLQRDEAVRSASLAAMTLMLAAEGMGLSTGPMGGFDPIGLASEFQLAANEVPVMLVTVGYAAPGNWPRKPRRPNEEILEFV
ncbi:nitroreductase family protein [Noviherbaspirillum saxi]|uniref:Nitroreductase family protein n=1 Tax=Noviherbaspirillum saxi TaxID=2320863 RepID=A0A3A3FKD1_9BURK|nr:nitroreductase family protein [Noviherbaspirillum saxi]RJF95943.1 nitroreductase family protein [Noviherbaspirillum saxi]